MILFIQWISKRSKETFPIKIYNIKFYPFSLIKSGVSYEVIKYSVIIHIKFQFGNSLVCCILPKEGHLQPNQLYIQIRLQSGRASVVRPKQIARPNTSKTNKALAGQTMAWNYIGHNRCIGCIGCIGCNSCIGRIGCIVCIGCIGCIG